MLLDNIYFDYIYRQELERLAIRSGWIDKLHDGDPLERSDLVMSDQSLSKRSCSILRLITLFDHIDSCYSEYDWSRFKDEGILAEDAVLHTYHNSLPKKIIWEEPNVIGDNVATFAHNAARKVFEEYRGNVIDLYLHYRLKGNFRTDVHAHRVYAGLSEPSTHYSSFESMFNRYLNNYHLAWTDAIDGDDFADFFVDIYSSVVGGIYLSCKKNGSLATVVSNGVKINRNFDIDIIDDLYYMARTKFTDEILILPDPIDIPEAVKMRKAKCMKRFRSIMAEWYDAILEGENIAEEKIRTDIGKANRELKKLVRWRSFNKSPINFWINAIGGQIPILSNILSLVSSAGKGYDWLIEKRHNWALVIQGEIDWI